MWLMAMIYFDHLPFVEYLPQCIVWLDHKIWEHGYRHMHRIMVNLVTAFGGAA